MSSQDFPKRLGKKFKAIRERRGLTPDEFALLVKAADGNEILSYENDTGDMSVSVLRAYVRVAGVPLENIWNDNCDLWFGFRVN